MTEFVGLFPPTDAGFTDKEDSAYYSEEIEDNTMRSDKDGGYEYSRPRFTRNGRMTYTTGFTDISQADKDLILEFWTKYTGAKSFTWVNPTNLESNSVRFTKPPKPTYTGAGQTRTYNVEVEIKQV